MIWSGYHLFFSDGPCCIVSIYRKFFRQFYPLELLLICGSPLVPDTSSHRIVVPLQQVLAAVAIDRRFGIHYCIGRYEIIRLAGLG